VVSGKVVCGVWCSERHPIGCGVRNGIPWGVVFGTASHGVWCLRQVIRGAAVVVAVAVAVAAAVVAAVAAAVAA
jgi:hypothetical protein